MHGFFTAAESLGSMD